MTPQSKHGREKAAFYIEVADDEVKKSLHKLSIVRAKKTPQLLTLDELSFQNEHFIPIGHHPGQQR
jgi:hypothetical protein